MGVEYKINKQGSLGLLALGHIGILKWREFIKLKNKQKEDSSKLKTHVKKKK
jgi:hypothetical protein